MHDYDRYVNSLLRGDLLSCSSIVRQLLANGVAVRSLYSDLFRESLYHVGELWETNRITVATEHLATAITERVMGQVVAPLLYNHGAVGRSMIISCVANEFHQVGGRMVADIAEMKGWDTCFLGANMPLQDLLTLVEEKRPDLLAFSTALYGNLPRLQQAIEAVRGRYPELPIWLGGQMFRWGGQELAEQYPQVKILPDLDRFDQELESYALSRKAL
jgi:methanogenic corrinoid protein MtbC1